MVVLIPKAKRFISLRLEDDDDDNEEEDEEEKRMV